MYIILYTYRYVYVCIHMKKLCKVYLYIVSASLCVNTRVLPSAQPTAQYVCMGMFVYYTHM